MADANPSVAENKPKLTAVPPEPGPAQASEKERRGVSPALFWIVGALLVLSLGGFSVQLQRAGALEERVAGLTGQVEGLQVQLAAANTRIQTYDLHRSLVADTVDRVNQELSLLTELVNSDPLEPNRMVPPIVE